MTLQSLQTLNKVFSVQPIQLDIAGRATLKKLPGATTGDPNTAFGEMIFQALNIAVIIGTVAVLLFLLLGAIEWITAGGDSGKIQKAREKITQAVIGLVVLISTVAILIFTQQLMGICVINFGQCAGSKLPAFSPTYVNCTEVDPNASCVLESSCNPPLKTAISGTCGTGRVCCAPSDKL